MLTTIHMYCACTVLFTCSICINIDIVTAKQKLILVSHIDLQSDKRLANKFEAKKYITYWI